MDNRTGGIQSSTAKSLFKVHSTTYIYVEICIIYLGKLFKCDCILEN